MNGNKDPDCVAGPCSLMDEALVFGTKDCSSSPARVTSQATRMFQIHKSDEQTVSYSVRLQLTHSALMHAVRTNCPPMPANCDPIQYAFSTYTVHSRMLFEPTALPGQEAQMSSKACLAHVPFMLRKRALPLWCSSRLTCLPRTKPGMSLARLFSDVAARRRHHVHQPGIEPGSHRRQRCILPLDH